MLHELEEGIDNHFTVTVPGFGDRYLVLPFGLHWSEARASELIVFDEDGNTLEGEGVVELSAQCIHGPIHRIAGARVVLHTHQTWALALNMLEDNRLVPASQSAAFRITSYNVCYTKLLRTVLPVAAARGDFADVDFRVEVGREGLAVLARVAVDDVERVNRVELVLVQPGGEHIVV